MDLADLVDEAVVRGSLIVECVGRDGVSNDGSVRPIVCGDKLC